MRDGYPPVSVPPMPQRPAARVLRRVGLPTEPPPPEAIRDLAEMDRCLPDIAGMEASCALTREIWALIKDHPSEVRNAALHMALTTCALASADERRPK